MKTEAVHLGIVFQVFLFYMTKNEFRKAATETGQVFWCKYSGHIQTFFVCCKNSHAGVYLQELAINSKANFKVVIG